MDTPEQFVRHLLTHPQRVVIEHAVISGHPCPRKHWPAMLDPAWREKVLRLMRSFPQHFQEPRFAGPQAQYDEGPLDWMFTCYMRNAQ